jgi:hypothetical protein
MRGSHEVFFVYLGCFFALVRPANRSEPSAANR